MKIEQDIENTELIDVSDIEPKFDGDLEGETSNPNRSAPMLGTPTSNITEGPTIASLKDRFSALIIDASIIYILYWFSMIIYRTIVFESTAGPIPVNGLNGIIFHALFLFAVLLLFVVQEAAFSATLGKFLCHLTIRHIDGAYPSFISVLVRNLFRPLDIILFPLFVTAALLEWSTWHQRLGDLIGRTVVLRRLGSPPHQHALSIDILGSSSGRAIAFLIDMIIFLSFTFGWALLFSPEAIATSMMLVVLFPIAAFLFFVLPEWLTKTSTGKWVLGYTICLEDGSAIDLSSAVVRTLWRLIDCNPFGFLTSLFSLRHQRPGDSAAGSVIIKAPREWKGLIGAGITLALSGIILWSGLQNRDNFLRDDFQINFLPSVDIGTKFRGKDLVPAHLMTKNFHFAAGDANTLRKPSIYQAGETLFLTFEVDGFKRDKNRVFLQEDLSVRYPDDTVALKLENINEFNQELVQEGPIRFENNIAIPSGAQAGRYTMIITIRDKLARQELKEQRFFYVTPTEPLVQERAKTPITEPSKGDSDQPKGQENQPPIESPPQNKPDETAKDSDFSAASN